MYRKLDEESTTDERVLFKMFRFLGISSMVNAITRRPVEDEVPVIVTDPPVIVAEPPVRRTPVQNVSPRPDKRKTFNFGERIMVWQMLYHDQSQAICHLCKLREVILANTSSWEIAHVMPWSLGGADTPDNLRPICRYCNRSMKDKHFKDYALEKYPQRFEEIVEVFRL